MRKLYDEGTISIFSDRKLLTKRLRNCFILLLSLTVTNAVSAQIVVTQNANAQDLAQSLAGSGVSVSNFSLSGNNNSSGTFINTSNTLGIANGVVLCTGNVANISQPASSFASSSYSGNGDAQLQSLTGGYIYDKSVLSFDVVPQGNVLMFNYVFASEEYPEWVCTQFNDVFGFFISGPNPAGGNYSSMNIAKVPNSNLPVAINTINPGVSGPYGTPANCQSLSYSSLFRSNLSPVVDSNIVYDGMTVVLTAVASVIPCQTYHLKLAIADVSDRIYDSGVFIEANSITSIPITITSTAQLQNEGYNSAYEGCVGGKFTFAMPSIQPADIKVGIQISGTATNGVDYPTIPSVITIPAGSLSTDINVMPIQDNMAEPDETIIISTTNPCTGLPISSAQMVIKDNIPTTVTANPELICAGGTTQMEATGGIHYSWTPATGLNDAAIYNPIASPSTTTTYTVSTDWGSCHQTATKTITVGGSPIQLTASPSLTSCDGNPVQLHVSGGSNYSWNNGGHAASINVTSTGNYTVTSTDASGCSTTASANVLISNLRITNPVVTPSCGGAANGGIDIDATGTGTPFAYHWSNSATTQDLTEIDPGNYSVTVSNADGCSATQSFNVSSFASNIQLSALISDVTCNGGNTGNIQLTATGGTAPYHFKWSNGLVTQNINHLGSGTYRVSVTDATGCMADTFFHVAQINGINIIPSVTPVSCHGGNNGAIGLSITGGNAPYYFMWSDSNLQQNRSALAKGNYTVTVSDGNGCFSIYSSSVQEPDAIEINISTIGTGCSSATGTANAVVAKGTAPYNYSWSSDSTIHTSNITGAASGNITVTVTDANSCTATQSAFIPATGNTTNADFNYSGNFCESNATVSFTHSGSSNVTSHFWDFGGSNHSALPHPSFTFANAGTYPVTHIITFGYCSDTVVKSVTIHASPLIEPTVNNISCNNTHNGAIQLAVSNGTSPYTYNWSGGIHTQNRSNLAAGNYSVTVIDGNQCSASFSTAITLSTGISITENHIDPTCFSSTNGSIDLSISGGNAPIMYHWNTGATTEDLSVLSAGTYTVTVTDANNCSGIKSVPLTAPSEMVINSTQADATCHGLSNGSIDISTQGGNGAYTYHWSNGANSAHISSLTAGYYTLTVTDGKNCSAISNFTIDEPVAMSVNPIKNDPLCFGAATGSIALDVNGGTLPYSFAWNNGATSPQLSNLAGGNYSVTITDHAGCQTQATIPLAQPSALSAIETHTNVGCMSSSGASIQLSVSGGQPSYSYLWNNGANTSDISQLNTGTYSVTITDANGCETKLTNIYIGAAPAINVVPHVTNAACAGVNNGHINLAISGGNAPFQFTWSNGSTQQNINYLSEGDYSVSVIDAQGCSQTASAYVNTNAGLQVEAQVMSPSCLMPEGAIAVNVLNGTAPFTFEWSNGSSAHQLTNLAPGTYSVAIRDANQCPFDSAFVIAENQPFTVTATGDGMVTLGHEAQLHVTSSGSDKVTYNWLPTADISCPTCADVTALPTRSTVYTVIATDTTGCVAQDTVGVEVIADNAVFLPNAFSPNGDGNNDLLQLYGNLAGIRYFQLLVFDRWGEKVFETNDQYFKWDGSYKGEKQEPAVYIYIMKIVHLDGTSDRTFKGALTLLK